MYQEMLYTNSEVHTVILYLEDYYSLRLQAVFWYVITNFLEKCTISIYRIEKGASIFFKMLTKGKHMTWCHIPEHCNIQMLYKSRNHLQNSESEYTSNKKETHETYCCLNNLIYTVGLKRTIKQ